MFTVNSSDLSGKQTAYPCYLLILSYAACPALHYYLIILYYLINGTIFGRKNVFRSLYDFCREHFSF